MNSGPCSFQLRSMFCGRMHPLFQPVFPRFPFSVAAFSFPSKVSVFFTPSVQPPVILSPVSCRGRSTLVLILPWHSSLGLVALSGSPMMLETGENLCAFSCSVTAFQQPPLRRNFIYLSFPFIILGSRNTVKPPAWSTKNLQSKAPLHPGARWGIINRSEVWNTWDSASLWNGNAGTLRWFPSKQVGWHWLRSLQKVLFHHF